MISMFLIARLRLATTPTTTTTKTVYNSAVPSVERQETRDKRGAQDTPKAPPPGAWGGGEDMRRRDRDSSLRKIFLQKQTTHEDKLRF